MNIDKLKNALATIKQVLNTLPDDGLKSRVENNIRCIEIAIQDDMLNSACMLSKNLIIFLNGYVNINLIKDVERSI